MGNHRLLLFFWPRDINGLGVRQVAERVNKLSDTMFVAEPRDIVRAINKRNRMRYESIHGIFRYLFRTTECVCAAA